MPDKGQIIREITDGERYWRATALKISRGSRWADDLYQEMLYAVLAMPEERLIQLHSRDEMKRFLCGVLRRMWTSNRSDFAKQHRHKEFWFPLGENTEYYDISTEDYEHGVEDMVNAVFKELERLKKSAKNWYDASLFSIVIEAGSSRQAAKITGIPRASINSTVKEVRRHLKSKLL